MITAHLPAGYVLTSAFRRRLSLVPLWWGLFASIFPDVDLLYFYLIDHRRTLHHRYWTHLPLVWIALGGVMIGSASFLRMERTRDWILVFVANVLLHLVLDTIVGKIFWLAPFDWKAFFLIEVPAAHRHWLLNFLLHWTVVFELVVWGGALRLWRVSAPPSRSTTVECSSAG